MAFVSRAASYPDFSSSGAGKFTPVIYAQKTLIKLYKSTVLSDITNTDYEGEIRNKGDKVIIRTVPDMVIKDYVKGQDLVYDTPESTAIEMTIDFAKYYASKIDRIDEVQNDIDQMGKWTDDAAQQMKIGIESAFFTRLFKYNCVTVNATAANAEASATCSSYNTGSASTGLGGVSGAYWLGADHGTYKLTVKNVASSTAYDSVSAVDVILGASSALTEQNVPESERWVVIPTWMNYMLQTGDLRRADSLGGPDNQDVLRKGKIGMLGNMTIYVSNNLPFGATATTAHAIPFGHKMALTFATQLVENESIPHPLAFGKIMRGLQVYGFKSVKPEAVGCGFAIKG